ncbi:asparagine synthase (glutamine-hydrolyzing) [Sinorhizobium meliloti]|uniref:asparagine synthase (glutamine-hydrolyzing) n=1 Tax=Rhizobium meliloti TaxID=382 RepID=UPI000FD71595|nr:asparagine synthase (glutamine-hydrolyzing) [Sinorhizobium meliloti]RVM17888.1 asparagine synthase (glutamine-hydrolyzing) [Sinorhizobium meliloti]RVO34202.1 asparagine synthase (glutamine-hydrolyzing) [Sinorhizobium meliloti]
MCGIFGVIERHATNSMDPNKLRRCIETISYRGPDATGVLVRNSIGFAHARLAIVDLDPRSDQPFIDSDTGIVTTYNGEIYNFEELRDELVRKGMVFSTRSDTEVLCKAYAAWGIAALEKLRGMFAFALYDPKIGETYLVRDRLGIKPLYYAELANEVIFASQPSAIAAWSAEIDQPDKKAMSAFLSFRAVMDTRSLFRGIRKLQPGTYLKINANELQERDWWNLDAKVSYDTSLRELLSTSVREHLTGDVPIAALLSGGLDSSIIAYEIASQSRQVATCFTGAVSARDYDESGYALEVAQHLDLECNVVDIDEPADLKLVEELVSRRCHPLGMHNEVAMYTLSKAVACDHKVVLTGEGSDELFAGYTRLFRLPFDLMRMRTANCLPSFLSARFRSLAALPEGQISEFDLFMDRYRYFPRDVKLGLFRKSFAEDVGEDEEIDRHLRNAYEKSAAEERSFDRLSRFFIRFHLPALLEMVDNVTMAAGIEGRVPFTDHRIVTAALALPEQEKLKWHSVLSHLKSLFSPISAFSEVHDQSKAILRRLYGPHLPNTVVTRRKMGFPIPLGTWAVSPSSEPFRALLFSSDCAVADIFDMDRLRAWYAANATAPSDRFGRQVWLIINLEIFLRRFF